jgi:hypothetical protein
MLAPLSQHAVLVIWQIAASTLTLASAEAACESSVPDDSISLLQTYTSVADNASRHRAPKLKQSGPKYELFGLQGDVDVPHNLQVHVSCSDSDAPFKSGIYHARQPESNDRDQVVYALQEADQKYSLSFPRGLHSLEAMDDEVALSNTLPGLTARAWKCKGEVMQADSLVAGGGDDFTYKVLVKTYVLGFALNDVLMTLAAPKNPWLVHKVRTPDSCNLGEFNEPTYNAVLRAFEPEKEFPLKSLQADFTPRLRCFFSLLRKTCKESGIAWSEIRPANMIYGTASNEDAPRLMLRNIKGIKQWDGEDRQTCLTKVESDQRQEWPSPSCNGPYWPRFFLDSSASCDTVGKGSASAPTVRDDTAAAGNDTGSLPKDLTDELDDVEDA